jgi:hypothetical protein
MVEVMRRACSVHIAPKAIGACNRHLVEAGRNTAA